MSSMNGGLLQVSYTLVLADMLHRFRKVPAFGRDTIRSFLSGNVADLKKLAARDYEDILQVECLVQLRCLKHSIDS